MSTSLEHAAIAAELAGDADGAVAARRELARLDPGSPTARLALAHSLEQAGAWRDAAQAYQEALLRGAQPAEAHLKLGSLYLQHARHGQALQHLKKALAAAPEDAQALFKSGLAMHRLRRYREAADYLQRALRHWPDAPEVHFNLGLARFELGDLAGALEAIEQSRALKRGRPWTEDPLAPLEREPAPALPEGEMAVNDVKLQHDLEQLEHLLEIGRLPAAYRKVAGEYRTLLQETRGVTGAGVVVPFNIHRFPLVARSYKRPMHVAAVAPGRVVLNPKLDAKKLENAYLHSQPNLMVVDDLLAPDALRELRDFCRQSTIWNNIQSGYLGAYFFDGFASELLLRIAKDLRERFPRVIRGLPLQMLWGYKYDHELQGIGVHADAAAVNVNFWITEDDANLDPEGGGLRIYRHAAPADWDFERFNREPAEIMRHLEPLGGEPIRVPHRANRAVIFDSDLFHATDALRFREGYLNRRINITLLYGLRSG
ncbi:MAG: tetratricopeptide repeat protein [Candidatus Parcubacteria bacterium]|nr:tetratricopeptide repeat protein [Burkholderiales bacterium]